MNIRCSILRTIPDNKDFQNLTMALDKELAIRDGELHSFYHQYNSLKVLDHVVVAYYNERAIACGALKKYHENSVEIKRMFVLESERGKGIASTILSELESWAKELKYERCILETGINQPEAINLYKKNNYTTIPNYGQYENIYNSVCFEKIL